MSAAARAARRWSPRRSATSCRKQDLLAYSTAILRVYNLEGRRDNKYKARIKILVHEMGTEELRQAVEAEFEALKDTRAEAAGSRHPRHRSLFRPACAGRAGRRPWQTGQLTARLMPAFAAWVGQNTVAHQHPDYRAVTISLKPIGGIPGDASADQMDLIADIAEQYLLRRTARQP